MRYGLGVLARCIAGGCAAGLAGIVLALFGVHPIIPAVIAGVLLVTVMVLHTAHPTVQVRDRAFIYEATLCGLLAGSLTMLHYH